jgi:hypothetical protein
MTMPIIHDGLKDAVLRAWVEPRPAAVVKLTSKHDEGEELHFWHASVSSSTSESIAASSAWIGIVFVVPDEVVSDALKVTLQVSTHPAYRR